METAGAGAPVGTTEDGLRVTLRGAADVARGALVPVTLRFTADGVLIGEPLAPPAGWTGPSPPLNAGSM